MAAKNDSIDSILRSFGRLKNRLHQLALTNKQTAIKDRHLNDKALAAAAPAAPPKPKPPVKKKPAPQPLNRSQRRVVRPKPKQQRRPPIKPQVVRAQGRGR